MIRMSASSERPFLVLAGLELSDDAGGTSALDQAARVVLRIPSSQLHLLHVLSIDASDDATQEKARLLRAQISAKAAILPGLAQRSVGVHVRRGYPVREIVQLANDIGADMIVLGHHRPAHLKSVLVGSTAEHVMNLVGCPVVVAGQKQRPLSLPTITIDPPCPDCSEVRGASEGHMWWCEAHFAQHHSRSPRVYSYQGALPFADHDDAP
jgi:nucleotide-binding universal stress UspA family protein